MLQEESLALRRALEDKHGIAWSLNDLGEVARCQGDYERAAALYEESLALWREQGNTWGIPVSLHNLGYVALHQSDYPRAMALFQEALALWRKSDNKKGVADCLAGLAGVAGAQGQPEQAARLFGAVEALKDAIGARIEPPDSLEQHRNVTAVRAKLGEAAFATAWAQGWAMTLEQAIVSTLEEGSYA